jgi:hypothetical protein
MVTPRQIHRDSLGGSPDRHDSRQERGIEIRQREAQRGDRIHRELDDVLAARAKPREQARLCIDHRLGELGIDHGPDVRQQVGSTTSPAGWATKPLARGREAHPERHA